MAAGEGSLGNPRIGEAGRLFLLNQLRRLTDDHLRALFTAARVEQMSDDHSWRDPETANGLHRPRCLDRGIQAQGPADRRAHLRGVSEPMNLITSVIPGAVRQDLVRCGL